MAVIAVLAFLLIVNPKRAEVADAQSQLEEAQSQELTKVAQRASLQQAEAEAPANRKIIRQVEQQLPPTADPQGFILLLENAAVKAGVDLTQEAIQPPLAAETGVTTIPITITLSGTYFSLDEFLFQTRDPPESGQGHECEYRERRDRRCDDRVGHARHAGDDRALHDRRQRRSRLAPGPTEATA